jgi:pimeloyl-ACP methyl ester carboxylesterase
MGVAWVMGGEGGGGARGVAVEWGGHWCYWEKPEKFNDLVIEFLR